MPNRVTDLLQHFISKFCKDGLRLMSTHHLPRYHLTATINRTTTPAIFSSCLLSPTCLLGGQHRYSRQAFFGTRIFNVFRPTHHLCPARSALRRTCRGALSPAVSLVQADTCNNKLTCGHCRAAESILSQLRQPPCWTLLVSARACARACCEQISLRAGDNQQSRAVCSIDLSVSFPTHALALHHEPWAKLSNGDCCVRMKFGSRTFPFLMERSLCSMMYFTATEESLSVVIFIQKLLARTCAMPSTAHPQSRRYRCKEKLERNELMPKSFHTTATFTSMTTWKKA